MKVSEIAATVNALSEQLVKVQAEILGKIEALETTLTDVDLPEDAIDALNALRGNVQYVLRLMISCPMSLWNPLPNNDSSASQS